jgi:hypothetical protein
MGAALGAVLVAVVTLPNLSCVPPPPDEPAIQSLPLDVESSGTLASGESKSFELSVQSGIHYAVSLVGSAGTIGAPDMRAQIVGATAPENVELTVRGLSLLRPEDARGFRALEDGVVELRVENRTEGLTIDQGFLSFLVGDASEAEYRIRAVDLGPDDHGDSPDNATRLADDGQALLGTIVFGDDFDFFIFPAEAGRRYQVTFEASGTAKLATGVVDRFDEFTFEAAPPGSPEYSMEATAGHPATKRFTAIQSRDILVGVAAGPDNVLAGIFGVPPGTSSFPVQYAITVTSSPDALLVSGVPAEDVVSEGDSLSYFIDLPADTQRIITELTGPSDLIVYVNPSGPGSALDHQSFASPIIEGIPASALTIPVPGATRYFFTVSTLQKEAADFSLRVTLE